ncbi:MAG: alpha/beta hydrolase [Candidatus Nanopelagicales bacterium]
MIINFGGPGEDGSALSLFTDNPLRRHFDLVSWDPRGVGSDPELAECGTPAMGSWRPRTGPFTWSQIARQTFRQRATVNRACVAANKKVLPYVGSNQVVRDLDAVREAVGQRRLTYVGFSYGTRLGRLYAQMFPDRVRAMVLDGVTGPYSRVSDYLTSSRRGGTAAWRWVRNGLAPPVRSLNNRLFTSLQSRTVVVDGVESDRWGLWWNLKSVLRSSRARTSTATVTCQWGQAAGLATTGCPPESSAPTALPAAVTLVDCSDLAGRVSPRRIGNSLARAIDRRAGRCQCHRLHHHVRRRPGAHRPGTTTAAHPAGDPPAADQRDRGPLDPAVLRRTHPPVPAQVPPAACGHLGPWAVPVQPQRLCRRHRHQVPASPGAPAGRSHVSYTLIGGPRDPA